MRKLEKVLEGSEVIAREGALVALRLNLAGDVCAPWR
jgi:hypothetical protein